MKRSLLELNNESMLLASNQKETELMLIRNEKRFRAMVQSGQDLIALIDQFFNIHYLSPNFEQIIGYSLDEMSGITGHSFVHPEDYETIKKEATKIFSQKIPAHKPNGTR